VLLVLSLVALAITFMVGWGPLIHGPHARALTDRTFEATPARLARGAYLVEYRYGCVGCHSDRDFRQPGGPVAAGRKAAGHIWSDDGMPWLVASNLTPDKATGVGNWSDDTLARAIREGIGGDGRALFPLMPYSMYRAIPDEDLASIIVYLRSLPAVPNALPHTAIPFPLNLLIRKVPQPLAGPVAEPDLSTPVKRGEYLVRTIDCRGCHTTMQRGERMASLDLAGGTAFPMPDGSVVAATNLTSDASGIPYYDEELFVEMMRTGKVKARQVSSVMPWAFFGGMTDEDLKAIYAYLKTLPAVCHRVDNTQPPTDCVLCGQKHGGGDKNKKS
jgi:mono/diheme cytochrome c family protein